eukprot:5814820-Pyramimonas_sp.AAC.1
MLCRRHALTTLVLPDPHSPPNHNWIRDHTKVPLRFEDGWSFVSVNTLRGVLSEYIKRERYGSLADIA